MPVSANGNQATPHKAAHSGELARANTLGMTKRGLDELLDELDQANDHSAGKSKRKFVRQPFRQLTLPVLLDAGGGGTIAINVCTRNLSKGGMAVLHRAYVHVGTKCSVIFTSVEGKQSIVRGTIVRCQHRKGNIHELGISFDTPVDPK